MYLIKPSTRLISMTLMATVVLTACGVLIRETGQETVVPTIEFSLVETATFAAQPTKIHVTPTVTVTTISDPTQPTAPPSASMPCQSDSLRISLTLLDDKWSCDSKIENWLAISSPTFQIQMSTLGQRVFYEYPGDSSCGKAPFYANDVLELDLWR
jgi:hypothetical protein